MCLANIHIQVFVQKFMNAQAWQGGALANTWVPYIHRNISTESLTTFERTNSKLNQILPDYVIYAFSKGDFVNFIFAADKDSWKNEFINNKIKCLIFS